MIRFIKQKPIIPHGSYTFVEDSISDNSTCIILKNGWSIESSGYGGRIYALYSNNIAIMHWYTCTRMRNIICRNNQIDVQNQMRVSYGRSFAWRVDYLF